MFYNKYNEFLCLVLEFGLNFDLKIIALITGYPKVVEILLS